MGYNEEGMVIFKTSISMSYRVDIASNVFAWLASVHCLFGVFVVYLVYSLFVWHVRCSRIFTCRGVSAH
jgi:hypothetical protein